jgi:hypothetical protein
VLYPEQSLNKYLEHISSQWGFREVRVARSLVFCVLFLGTFVSHFFCFLLAIVFSVLQFTDPDYPFGKFIRFLPVLSGVRSARSLVFCVVFCKSIGVLLSPFFFAIVLSVPIYEF